MLDPDRRAELEGEKDFLLRSLDDLDREVAAGDLDAADDGRLRDRYTARLAEVLRELGGTARPADSADDRASEGPAVAVAGTSAAPRRRRRGRTALLVAAVALLAVGAGVAVAAFAGQRLPGSTATGDIADTVNSKLAEARALQASDPRAAIDRFDEVLRVDPDNPEALTYRGWLIARVGAEAGAADLVEDAERLLDRAIAVAPTYADPHCFKAIIEFRYRSDAAAAKQPVDTCLAANPPQEVRGLVEGLKNEIDAALAGGATTTAPATTTP
jgi:hypothetical protein